MQNPELNVLSVSWGCCHFQSQELELWISVQSSGEVAATCIPTPPHTLEWEEFKLSALCLLVFNLGF